MCLCTYYEVDERQQEKQHDDTDCHVALTATQARLVQTLLLDGHIAGLEIAVVLLVNAPPLYGLLPHGSLDGPIGALLRRQRVRRSFQDTTATPAK